MTIGPIHPGEHLAEYLEEYGISQYRLARDLGVPPRRINEIVKGCARITADNCASSRAALRHQRQFWLNLQAGYDLAVAQARSVRAGRRGATGKLRGAWVKRSPDQVLDPDRDPVFGWGDPRAGAIFRTVERA